jgi:hypothetical protein
MRHDGDASQQRAFRRQVVQELSSAGPCTKGHDPLRVWVRKYEEARLMRMRGLPT